MTISKDNLFVESAGTKNQNLEYQACTIAAQKSWFPDALKFTVANQMWWNLQSESKTHTERHRDRGRKNDIDIHRKKDRQREGER